MSLVLEKCNGDVNNGLLRNTTGKSNGWEKALFHGKDLLKLSDKEIRAIRGKHISMVFQEPMTSLESSTYCWRADCRNDYQT